MTTRTVHYVLSTHWDREWYETFQNFRYRLVQLIDRLLEGWQNETLLGPFQTDGQAIILEDYLEVRPEKTAQIHQLVKDDKFKVGPWYVMPDEFLVSGESLVRNLRLGRQIARLLGGTPSNAGFLCDMFGHNSQMPQIFAGFGIRGGFVWRGINLIDQRLFRWRGADGTEMPTYRFGLRGYCSYAAQVRKADHSQPEMPDEQIAGWLESYLQGDAQITEVDPILAFDGGDHMEWDPQVYTVLAKRLDQPDESFVIKHTHLDAYLEEMLAEADKITTVVDGELREPARYPDSVDGQWLIPGVTSSRVWIKQSNAACETALCLWAEPINAFTQAALGIPYPQGFMDVAWKWLLQNHPHDSMCGCSIDAVHEDMTYRFHQAAQIADRLTREASRKMIASVPGVLASNELRLGVFNPLPRPLSQVSDLVLDIPVEWPGFAEMIPVEIKPAFRIYDPRGKEIPYQRLSQYNNSTRTRTYDARFPTTYKVNVVNVSLPLELPALGYSTFTIRAGEAGMPTRHALGKPIASNDHSMVGEILALKVDPYGTIDLIDLRNGQVYNNLLAFEDCADVGDGWNFGPVTGDRVYLSSASKTDVALVHNGPYKATFLLRNTMEVPEEFDFSANQRSTRYTNLIIDSLVSLRAGTDWVEVETTVYNNVKDHRLRVLFPTGASASTYLADSQFDVVERAIALRPDNYLYREQEVETKPQQSWTAVFDPQRGLAVVSAGLLESAVQDLPQRPIALTLFRSTSRTVNTDGEPGGQLQGPLTYKYWIVPLAGAPSRARLSELGQRLAAGLHTVTLTAVDVARYRSQVPLPPQASFLELEGAVVMTSCRQVGEGLEVRLFNPDTSPVEATLDVSGWSGEASRPTRLQGVNFESNPIADPVGFLDSKCKITLRPKQIVTVKLW